MWSVYICPWNKASHAHTNIHSQPSFAPRTTRKNFPISHSSENTQKKKKKTENTAEMWRAVSRFQLPPPLIEYKKHLNARTPKKLARTKTKRDLCCAYAHIIFWFFANDFSLSLFFCVFTLPWLKIHTENTLTKSAENVLVGVYSLPTHKHSDRADFFLPFSKNCFLIMEAESSMVGLRKWMREFSLIFLNPEKYRKK